MVKNMINKAKWNYFLFLVVSIFIYSCSTELDSPYSVSNSGSFRLNGTKYNAEYALYANSGSNYDLYFYSENISFLDYPFSLFGYGNIVKLSLNESIFKSTDYVISNIKLNETINVINGDIYINYSDSNNIGSHYEIDRGTLTIQVKKGFYLFNYDLIQKSGETITGSYTGSLIVF